MTYAAVRELRSPNLHVPTEREVLAKPVANPYEIEGRDTEGSLRTKDFLGLIVGTIITLGPLAATALFAH